MIKKFAEWWKQKANVVEHEVNKEYGYRYETTLVRDLKAIADLLGKEFPFDKPYGYSGKYRFRTQDKSQEDVKNTLRLKTLQVAEEHKFIRVIYWHVDEKEFKSVYESKYSYYKKTIRNLLKIIEANFNNPDYFYTFCKYEDSIHIVANTLKDERENNDGDISKDVFEKSKTIIEKLGFAVVDKYEELKNLEKLQKEAVSKSLVNRLNDELDFMNNYIETQ